MDSENRYKRITWDEYFSSVAKLVSRRSEDPNTQVGAVIVDSENKIIGCGYNGFIRGVNSSKFPMVREGDLHETKYAYIIHAEANALLNVGLNLSVKNSRIYTTLFPCNECAKLIVQSGIKEVIYLCDKYHDMPSFIASRYIFDVSGVTYREYKCEKET